MARNDEYWIQDAIKKPGSLRGHVARIYGKRGFTRSRKTGKPIIRSDVLRKLAKKKGKIGHRARLAITLRKLRRRRGRR